jgi:hypothetical protein
MKLAEIILNAPFEKGDLCENFIISHRVVVRFRCTVETQAAAPPVVSKLPNPNTNPASAADY